MVNVQQDAISKCGDVVTYETQGQKVVELFQQVQ
jgi:hypothetical protein